MPARKAKQTEPEPEEPDTETAAAPSTAIAPAADTGSSAAAIAGILSDRMVRIAKEYPRDERLGLQRALDGLKIVPWAAEKAWYRIEYRNHRRGCTRPRDKKGRINCDCEISLVEGLSIRAAEDLLGHYGNAAARAYIAQDTDTLVRVVGVFLDLEHNVWKERDFVAAKTLMRGGTLVKLSGQDLAIAMQAATSKAIRNATLSGLPVSWKILYWQRAREINAAFLARQAGGYKPAVERMLKRFEALGVTSDVLEAKLGHSLADGVSRDEGLDLLGLCNALENRETTIEQVFEPLVSPLVSPEVHAITPEAFETAGAETEEIDR